MPGRTFAKRVKSLHNMEYDEVSLVDIPANQHAAVMIAKRHDQGADMPDDDYEGSIFADEALTTLVDEADLETGDIVYSEDGTALRYTAPEADEAELVGAGVEKRAGNALLGLGSRQVAKRAPAGRGEDLATQISKALTAAQSDADRDEVIKSFAGLVQEQQEQLNEVAKAAEYERDLRLTGQYVEVAKNLGLPGDPEELGPVLKRMADVMSDEDIAVIAKTLDAASGVLYEELGYSGFGAETGDPDMADAEAAAESAIAKSGAERISKAEGVEMYYDQNPDAYDAYMASRR
jgi:hypothetical protein